jgi:hypothetical protein
MEPWDLPSFRTCYALRRALLQMEKEKTANKATEEMMNRIKELFSTEELSLEDEEVLEEQTYEESYQEDPDELLHVEDPYDTFDEDEALISTLPLDEYVHLSTPPTHKDKEKIIFGHANRLMKEPLYMVDEHIDNFIRTSRCRWDFGHLIFYRDPIYDVEGSPQEKGFDFSYLED